MASETLVADPTSEDATNTQLSLENAGSGLRVRSQDYGVAERKRVFASSIDTRGNRLAGRGDGNREIELVIRCFGTEAVTRAAVKSIQQKVGKWQQYGGTLKRTLNNGDTVVFDILDATVEVPADWLFVNRNEVAVKINALALPYGRGPSSTYTLASESTNPELSTTVTAPAGDVPALGILEITEAQGADQAFVQWAVECRNYGGTGSTYSQAYSGASRLAYNGSSALAVSGALSGTVLNQGTLTASYQAVCSIASSGTVYPQHVGTYGIWARLYMGTANAGTVTAALEWAQGDLLNYTRNDGTILGPTRAGAFLHTYLGQVTLEKAVTGTQRWDGRLIAKSSSNGDDLAVDRWYVVPVDEGYGEVRSVVVDVAPTTFSARDGFDQSAGAATGKTLPTGGTWGGSGDADDFAIGSGSLYRTASADANTEIYAGRFLTASGSSAMTDSTVKIVFDAATVAAAYASVGIVLRYTDINNFVAVYSWQGVLLRAVQRVAGTMTYLQDVGISSSSNQLTAIVDKHGNFSASYGGVSLAGYSAALATGGALASGKVGVVDWQNGSDTSARSIYDFFAYAPVPDAAVFASKKLQVRNDRVHRQESSGTAYGKPGDVRGTYLQVPAVNVGGTVRVFVKASRTVPETGADPAIDDISAQLTVTPQYLNIPE